MVTTTYKACLMIRAGLYKVRARCETLSEARLWAMKEAKELVADSCLSFDDVSVKIDEKKIYGYEISSAAILNHSSALCAHNYGNI